MLGRNTERAGMKNHLVVNSLGEVIDTETDKCVGLGISGSEAVRKHDPDLFYNPMLRKTWSGNYATYPKRYFAACDKAWRLEMYENLAYRDALWVFKVWELQKLNDAFCRVWGEHGRIWASVEFNNFHDKETIAWWRSLDKQVAKFADRQFLMGRFPHSDKKMPKGSKKWITGPNHGRMEKQVAVEMELFMGDTLTQVRAKRKYLMRFFKKFWKEKGVNVI
jgi:hypothetical protein